MTSPRPNRNEVASRSRRMTAAAMLVGGGLSLAGCGPAVAVAVSPPAPASAAGRVVVESLKPVKVSLRRMVEQPGTIEAFEETRLFARVSGYVGKVAVDIGDRVRGPKFDDKGREVEPGQILVEVDAPEVDAEASHRRSLVLQALAGVEQAEKAFASSSADIATAEASVAEATALQERWDSEAQRMAGLVKGGVVDGQAGDETRYQSRSAAARLASTKAAVCKAQADREKAASDVAWARSRVAVAEAELKRLEVLRAFAKVRAPFDGVVTVRKVCTGDSVQPNGAQGEWLFTVAKLDPVRVIVSVPEADAALVAERADVSLSVPAGPGMLPSAQLARTSWALDPTTRTLRAEIDLPNPDGRLRPGMYVYAKIVQRLPEAWTLPAAAVVKHADGPVCFRIVDGKAVRTLVQVGRTDGDRIEVRRWAVASTPTAWSDFTGEEAIAAKAVGLVDGASVR